MLPQLDSPAVLEVSGLEKWYGPLPAVRDISFRLETGEFLTLFGPNGAGKTTLLRLLAGVLRPTRGEVRITGGRIAGRGVGMGSEGEWRKEVGVLSHQTFLYGGLSAAENLEFYARLYRLPERRVRVEHALEQIGLWERRGDHVRTFSRGMQQRLALARALLHEPALLLLDEPYTGLDPHAARLLRRLLERLKDGSRTVILVTHNLSQGLELADRVAIQVGGRWISDEPRSALDVAGWEAIYSERVGVG